MSLELIRLTSFYSDDVISGIKLLQDKISKDVQELEYYSRKNNDFNDSLQKPIINLFNNFFENNYDNKSGGDVSVDKTGLNNSNSGNKRSVKNVVSGLRNKILANSMMKLQQHQNISNSRSSNDYSDASTHVGNTEKNQILYDNGEVPVGVQLYDLQMSELKKMTQEFIERLNEYKVLDCNSSSSSSSSISSGKEDVGDNVVRTSERDSEYNDLIKDFKVLRDEKIEMQLLKIYGDLIDSGESLSLLLIRQGRINGSVEFDDSFKNLKTKKKKHDAWLFPIQLNNKMVIDDDFELHYFINIFHKIPFSKEDMVKTGDGEVAYSGKRVLQIITEMFSEEEEDGEYRATRKHVEQPSIIEIERLFHQLLYMDIMEPIVENHKGYQCNEYYKFSDKIKDTIVVEHPKQDSLNQTIYQEYHQFIEFYMQFVKLFNENMIEYNDICMRKLMFVKDLYGSTTNRDYKIDYLKEMGNLYISNTSNMINNIGNFQFLKNDVTASATLPLHGINMQQTILEKLTFNTYKETVIEPVVEKLNMDITRGDIDSDVIIEMWFKNEINDVMNILKMKQYLVKLIYSNDFCVKDINEHFMKKFVNRQEKKVGKNRDDEYTYYYRLINILKQFLIEYELIKYNNDLNISEFDKIIKYLDINSLETIQLLKTHFHILFQSQTVSSEGKMMSKSSKNILLFSQLFFHNNSFTKIDNLEKIVNDVFIQNNYSELIQNKINNLSGTTTTTTTTTNNNNLLFIPKRTRNTSSSSITINKNNKSTLLSTIHRKFSNSSTTNTNTTGLEENASLSSIRSVNSTLNSSRRSSNSINSNDDTSNRLKNNNSTTSNDEYEFIPKSYKRLSSLPLPSSSSSSPSSPAPASLSSPSSKSSKNRKTHSNNNKRISVLFSKDITSGKTTSASASVSSSSSLISPAKIYNDKISNSG